MNRSKEEGDIIGEATYYIKAYYNTESEAETALEKLEALITELDSAHAYWQSHRGEQPEVFWKNFTEQFPLSTNLLECEGGGLVNGPDCNNGVAGSLSYTDGKSTPFQTGSEVCYSANVWHFADWSALAGWLKDATGAHTVNWLSDEDMDPFDAL